MGPAPLVPAAAYARTIRASVERIFENALDWEHLPWLHGDSFSRVDLIEASSGGWRARVRGQPAEASEDAEIELVLDPSGPRYVTRTLSGRGAGTEIWTLLEPIGEQRTRIRVEFCVPRLEAQIAAQVGRAYVRLYTKLWDEDEEMMVRRTEVLSRPRGRPVGSASVPLGPESGLRERLPLEVELEHETFRVVAVERELHAYPVVCPHLGGPLGQAPGAAGVVACPWHGYRFDLRSGESADGRGLCFRLRARVRVNPETGMAFLESG
ncbi:MAG: Rieske 2Fe-2S domain-containing protein [Myxococcales bacterium]|nr:Rieske 2Fe-2S domain-containing protein [Myxococcales bacterium]